MRISLLTVVLIKAQTPTIKIIIYTVTYFTCINRVESRRGNVPSSLTAADVAVPSTCLLSGCGLGAFSTLIFPPLLISVSADSAKVDN